jgi:hypothetical protein
MSWKSGLTNLFDTVKADLDAQNFGCEVRFGRREVRKQINQGLGMANRVIFEPGDPSGNAGEYAPAREPGRAPTRPLFTFNESVTIWVWAFDGRSKDDERKQYEAVRQLHDIVIAAIYRASRGTFSISAPAWIVEKNERVLGCEMAFSIMIASMVPEVVYQVPEPGEGEPPYEAGAPWATGHVPTIETGRTLADIDAEEQAEATQDYELKLPTRTIDYP